MTSETETDSETIHEVGDVDSVLSERCFGGVRVFAVLTCHVLALVTTENWTIISGRNCGINAVLRVEARGFFFDGGAREFESSYGGTHVR